MKVKTQGKFSLSKKAKIAIAAGSAVVVGITALIVVGKLKDNDNFYTKFNEFASVETCNFRYVIDVRSAEAKGTSMTAEELESALNDTAFENAEDADKNKGYEYEETTEGNYVAPEGDQTGQLYESHIQTDWISQDGSTAVDWNYPNYELIVEGRVESVEPLKASVQMRMITDYTDAPFLNATFLDGKCYFDVFTLKDWLLSAGDSSLVQLGKSIPDGVVYIVVDEKSEMSFATGFAEEDELEYSGATDVYNFYKRFVQAEKLCLGAIQKGLGDEGLSKDDTKYRLSLAGDSSVKLVQNLRGMLNNSGLYYDNYVSNISKAGLADEKQVAQLVNEKDNFLYAIQPLWSAFNTLDSEDMKNLNLTVVGKARDYTSSGTPYKEVTLGASYNWEGTEYIISVYGCKSGLGSDNGIKVDIPKETVTEISRVPVDFGAMSEYLFAYFKVTPEYPVYQLNPTWETFEDNRLRDFVAIVNAENAREETGLAEVNMYNIKSYISNYAGMTEVEYNANPATKFNYELVQKYMGSAVENAEPDTNSDSNSTKVVGKNIKMTVEGVDIKLSGAKMTAPNVLSVTLSAKLNSDSISSNSGVSKSLDLTQFYVLDKDKNKYPCNHKDFIREANIGVPASDVATELSVTSELQSVTLYFITNKYDDYTICFDDFTLGSIVEVE